MLPPLTIASEGNLNYYIIVRCPSSLFKLTFEYFLLNFKGEPNEFGGALG